MKKTILLVAILSVMAVIFSGCTPEKQAKIEYYECDWPYYDTQELTDKCTDIFEGKIVNISFKMIDIRTGKAAAAVNTDNMLYTVYEIETPAVYKGNNTEKKSICVMGGISRYKESEQIDLMKKYVGTEHEYIPVVCGADMLEINASYLFTVCDLGGDYLYVPNLDQFAFEIETEQASDTTALPNYVNVKRILTDNTQRTDEK